MINVSKRYKDKIYAPIRKTTAKVVFEILDNAAYEDNVMTVSASDVISRNNQLTNKTRIMSHKYATFEKDYFKLDGSFCIPPKSTEGNSELGYWSDVLSNESGEFSDYPVIEINFGNTHSTIGLAVSFDILTNEYAVEFDLEIFQDSNLIHMESVTDNKEPLYVLEQPLDNYNKIILTIKKWCKGYRRARVVEVDFGLVKEYKDDKLIKLNVLEEINITGNNIPSNELVFTVDNSDRRFNILNPQGYFRYLQEQQEVKAEIGLQVDDTEEYEFISLGKYYLTDWQSDEGTLTTTFVARDIFEILQDAEYSSISNTTLYDLAIDVLTKAGIKDYLIDSRLKTISTNGFLAPLPSRSALQYIGVAGQSMVYQDRKGVLCIRHIETLTESTGYLCFAGMDNYAGATTPQVDENYDIKYIDFDNAYEEPRIKLDKPIKSVSVLVFDGTVDGQEIKVVNAGVNKGVSYKLQNELINTVEHANAVANWIIRESNLRALYSVNWRQNPSLECGDMVLIEDGFNEKKRSRITKQEFIYDGTLRGKTETKGGI